MSLAFLFARASMILLTATIDSDSSLVARCLRIIHRRWSSEAPAILRDVLRDRNRDEYSRETAAGLLLESGQVQDVETVLIEAVAQGQNQSVSENLFNGVVRQTINIVMLREPWNDKPAAELRALRGRNCVRKLEAMVAGRHQPFGLREASIEVLRGIQDPRSFSVLLRLANDYTEHREFRKTALQALPDLDSPRAVRLFWQLLDQPAPHLPTDFIAATLANQGDGAIVRLAERFAHRPEVREALIKRGHASRLPRKQAIESINALLAKEQQDYLHETLVAQLLDLEGEEALVRLSQHESARVRAWAAYFAFRTGLKDAQSDVSKQQK